MNEDKQGMVCSEVVMGELSQESMQLNKVGRRQARDGYGSAGMSEARTEMYRNVWAQSGMDQISYQGRMWLMGEARKRWIWLSGDGRS
jgi:hypothetical protein